MTCKINNFTESEGKFFRQQSYEFFSSQHAHQVTQLSCSSDLLFSFSSAEYSAKKS